MQKMQRGSNLKPSIALLPRKHCDPTTIGPMVDHTFGCGHEQSPLWGTQCSHHGGMRLSEQGAAAQALFQALGFMCQFDRIRRHEGCSRGPFAPCAASDDLLDLGASGPVELLQIVLTRLIRAGLQVPLQPSLAQDG